MLHRNLEVGSDAEPAGMRAGANVGEDLRLRDRMIAEQQARVDYIFGAIQTGEFPCPSSRA